MNRFSASSQSGESKVIEVPFNVCRREGNAEVGFIRRPRVHMLLVIFGFVATRIGKAFLCTV